MSIYHIYRGDPIGYDEHDAFIIVADSEAEARVLASMKAADEGADVWAECKCINIGEPIEDTPRIVLASFNAG